MEWIRESKGKEGRVRNGRERKRVEGKDREE